MFPKKHRFLDRRDVSVVFRFGKRAYGSLFSVIFLPNNSGEKRVSVVVSKKVFSRSVDRHQLKRLVRAVLWRELSRIQPGMDFVLIAIGKPEGIPGFSDILKDIDALFRRTRNFL